MERQALTPLTAGRATWGGNCPVAPRIGRIPPRLLRLRTMPDGKAWHIPGPG